MSRNFIAIDVETANLGRSSICQIGFVHVHDKNLQGRKRILINPECDFHYICIAKHGIRPADVEEAPTMLDVWGQIQHQTKNSILVSHTGFDSQAFSKVAKKLGLPQLSVRWADSKQIAKEVWPNLQSYRLDYLAEEFGITFQHHDALEDAVVAAKIVIRALDESNTDIEEWVSASKHSGRRTTSASHKIIYRPEQHIAEISLKRENVLFTGTLRDRFGKKVNRPQAGELVKAYGGTFLEKCRKSVTMLVVGEQDKRVLKGRDQSGSHRKVLEWIKKGQKIEIVSAQEFFDAVGEIDMPSK